MKHFSVTLKRATWRMKQVSKCWKQMTWQKRSMNYFDLSSLCRKWFSLTFQNFNKPYNLCIIEQYTNHEKRNLFHKNNPSRSCLLFEEMQCFKFYFLDILFFVTFLSMLATITVLCLKILKLKTKTIIFEILFSYFCFALLFHFKYYIYSSI